MNAELTVLMSVYNGENFLKEAIDSILNQSYRDFEFLIINDASTDSSRDIILSYKDPRIRLIDNEVNIGLTRSLNKGLRLAKGKYIARMDADDISLPNRLDEELSIIRNDNEIKMVTGWINMLDPCHEGGDYFKIVRTANSDEEIYYTLLFQNCIAHSTVLFDKELVISSGGYDENYVNSQDYDLWIRLSRNSKIKKIKKPLIIRRSHENAISNKSSQQKINADKIFLKNISDLLPEEIDQNILLMIRYNHVKIKHLIESIKILKRINDRIVENSNSNLDKNKLRKCGTKRIYSMTVTAIKDLIKEKYH